MVICEILAQNEDCTAYNRPNAKQMRHTHWAKISFSQDPNQTLFQTEIETTLLVHWH